MVPALALNLFHDAVELAFLAIEDKLGLSEKIGKFKTHINEIKKASRLGAFPQARHLNTLDQTRGNFKHNGVIPNLETIKELAIRVEIFFEEISPIFFKKEFDEINLSALIENKEIRQYLESAELSFKEQNYLNSIKNSAISLAYAKRITLNKNQFRFEDSLSSSTMKSKLSGGVSSDLKENLGYELEPVFDEYNEAFGEIYDCLKLLIIGVDIRKYYHFLNLTPSIQFTVGGRILENWTQLPQLNREDAKFCIDFVYDFFAKTQII